MVDVGKRIKKARKIAGLTQIGLAKKIHLSQSYIANIENNVYNPSIETLRLISEALHVDIAEFVGNGVTIQKTGLRTDEMDLVMTYRRLSEEQKALTKAMVYNFVPPKARYSTSTSSPKIRTRKVAMGG